MDVNQLRLEIERRRNNALSDVSFLNDLLEAIPDPPPKPVKMQVFVGGIQELDEIKGAVENGWKWGLSFENVVKPADLQDRLTIAKGYGRRAAVVLTHGAEEFIPELVEVIEDSGIVDWVEVEAGVGSSSWKDSHWVQLRERLRQADLDHVLYSYMTMWQDTDAYPAAKRWSRRSRHWYLRYEPGKAFKINQRQERLENPSSYPVDQIRSWLTENRGRNAAMYLGIFGQPRMEFYLPNKRPCIANSPADTLMQLKACDEAGITKVCFWSVRNGWWVNGRPAGKVDKAWDYTTSGQVANPKDWERLWHETIAALDAYLKGS